MALNIWHVVPIDDTIDHTTDDDACACCPTATFVRNEVGGPDGWLLTHHSLDGREMRERAAAGER